MSGSVDWRYGESELAVQNEAQAFPRFGKERPSAALIIGDRAADALVKAHGRKRLFRGGSRADLRPAG